MATNTTTTPSEIYARVTEHYSAAASKSADGNTKYGEAVAKSFGYTEEELSAIPEGANLGLSCGNPLAITSLREGETIIDLGSGAGFDVFLASSRVGPTGRAIGVDMNDDMLARANKIKSTRANAENVTFVKGKITDIPLPDGTADVIISNCVINLVPEAEKPAVFGEMYRLLKPGGRVAVSDILAKRPLPEKLREDMALYVGCIAGAGLLSDYEGYLKGAGFDDILITDTKSDLNVYLDTNEDGTNKKTSCEGEGGGSGCCAPTSNCCAGTPCTSSGETEKSESKSGCSTLPTIKVAKDSELAKTDLNEFVGSYKIYAVKN